jgi:hypothetical protein
VPPDSPPAFVALVLQTAFRHAISEANPEAAYERFVELVGHTIGCAAFCDAVAACLRDHLIREPIRLPEHALQCHWCLELTARGVAAARALPGETT